MPARSSLTYSHPSHRFSIIDPVVDLARYSVTYHVCGYRRANFGGVKQGAQP